MATQSNTAPLIVIVGETAGGKSAIAVSLARELDGEIVCADSRTIYKQMNIGTAKPTLEQMQGIRHHMLDIVYPDQKYSAAQFQMQANKAIDDIWSRGNWPILVGGSGLYIDSVLFNYNFRQVVAESKRSKLASMNLEELNQLALANDLYVSDSKNKRYLIRLLETGVQPTNNRDKLRPNTLVIGVSLARSTLRKNIETRVETMFRQGLRKEVDELHNTYRWDAPGMNGIGYREFRGYYEDGLSMTKVKADIFRNTLQLAKRQRTWFKRNPKISWYDNYNDIKISVQRFVVNFSSNSKYNG